MVSQFLIPEPIVSPKKTLGIFFELTKIHLSLYIALSGVLGHVLAQNRFTLDSFFMGFFVLILSSGSGVLNNIQDRDFDQWFPRTRHRSLVKKRILVSTAGLIALALIITGLGGLFFYFPGILPAGIGFLALICYNGLYTPLKKRSLAAIVPGTLCGMLPPVMGWVAVPRALALVDVTGLFIVMLVFGLWQVPHFFIILLKQAPRDLNAPAYPCFSRIFSREEIKAQVLIYTCLYSLGILLFLVRGWIHSPVLSLSLCMVALSLVFLMAAILKWRLIVHSLPFCFAILNLSMLLFIGIGILDRILFFQISG
jgi:protoheme IX farnesyltransferase